MAEDANHQYYDDSGGIPWDSQLATIGSKSFILEELQFTEPSNFVQSNNVNGAPRGGRDIAGVITGSATAQFPSGATMADVPKRFAEVTLKYRSADKVFVITEVGTPQKAGQETKVSLKLREKLLTTGGTGGA